MEQLRNMYKSEIDDQAAKIEQQKVAAKDLETKLNNQHCTQSSTLKHSIAEYKREIEELNG